MLITLFGGSGFIGEYLVRALTAQKQSVRLALRGEGVRLGKVYMHPQLEFFAYSPHDKNSIAHAVKGADIVINLIGILNEVPRKSFAFTHSELPGLIARACRAQAVSRMIHISALGARTNASSAYLRSKAAGEKFIRAEKDLNVTIIRPAIILGKGGGFVRLMLKIARFTPLLLLPCGFSRVQPMAVQDLIRLLLIVVEGKKSIPHRSINAAGPRLLSMRQLVAMIFRFSPQIRMPRAILPLGYKASYTLARIMEMLLADSPVTRDNCLSMKKDSPCPEAANDALRILGELLSVEEGLQRDFAAQTDDKV